MANGWPILTACAGCSLASPLRLPMVKLPPGSSIISGQVSQSLKVFAVDGVVPATLASAARRAASAKDVAEQAAAQGEEG